MKITDTLRLSISKMGLGFAFGGPLVYASIRFYEAYGKPPMNPLLIIADTHIAYFWRIIIALWMTCIVTAALSLSYKPSSRIIAIATCAASLFLVIVAWKLP